MHNQYGNLASQVYQLDKPIGVSFGDIEYYRSRLASVAGAVLEPAVGNGRFLIPMLQAGIKIAGYDSSPQMLQLARAAVEQLALNTTLSQADFASFESDQLYAAIVIPAGSFQLVTEFDQACQLLTQFYQQLESGGRLMLDLDASQLIFNQQPSVRHWQLDQQRLITLTSTPLSIDHIAQTTSDLHRYELWEQGQLVHTESETFSLRWWSCSEINMALQLAGFENITLSGGYQFQKPPSSDDQLISIEASKP